MQDHTGGSPPGGGEAPWPGMWDPSALSPGFSPDIVQAPEKDPGLASRPLWLAQALHLTNDRPTGWRDDGFPN